MRITRFEDLGIWKLSLKITKEIYDLTSKKEFSKDFGLRDQIRRAIISVSSNIVEGFEKNNALIVNYITQEEFDRIYKETETLSKQIGGFIVYLETKRKSKEFLKK